VTAEEARRFSGRVFGRVRQHPRPGEERYQRAPPPRDAGSGNAKPLADARKLLFCRGFESTGFLPPGRAGRATEACSSVRHPPGLQGQRADFGALAQETLGHVRTLSDPIAGGACHRVAQSTESAAGSIRAKVGRRMSAIRLARRS